MTTVRHPQFYLAIDSFLKTARNLILDLCAFFHRNLFRPVPNSFQYSFTIFTKSAGTVVALGKSLYRLSDCYPRGVPRPRAKSRSARPNLPAGPADRDHYGGEYGPPLPFSYTTQPVLLFASLTRYL